MARQRRPRPAASSPATTTSTAPGGETVSVNRHAVNSWGSAASGPDSGLDEFGRAASIREIRDQLGNEGLRQAAIDAGHRPPSDRTLRRWAQQNRIPRADVARIAQRRVLVDRLGGVSQVAQRTGRSESSIRTWQAGKNERLRGDAAGRWKTPRWPTRCNVPGP